ncbi:MAG: formate dehydrogenase accessory sulfurtransferase FdhD [Bradyrhizobium sp.]|uniref:formate dehydrogenase accessory sulfurtransferase FdhD n=1 Tax=Bradyrhizobium sp. TaxID=376 RepID=UPI001A2C78ED|nr:formate dehydrogenase accessory sulfurtransferase FdhD [Bradyrhizobium sp.]MBJ7401923.1 formate dehydrogenase accessory sulfurtransferase FdhD [Bradyrhizobium sp.]
MTQAVAVRPALTRHDEIAWRRGQAASTSRLVAEETAVALSYNGSTHAVMMATPADLEDFGVGFTLTEGIVRHAEDIESVELIPDDLGLEVRIWLSGDRAAALTARRRALSGPVGCGLCGIESLEQARRPAPLVTSRMTFGAEDLLAAMQSLAPLQTMNLKTKSMHAAAFWQPSSGIGPVREDVGRHNALDKLAGAIVGSGLPAAEGAVLLTSRVSVEMVQKVAMIGAPIIIAVSAPTTLAIRTAEEAGITLLAIAREDGFGVFTHPHRVIWPADALQRAS